MILVLEEGAIANGAIGHPAPGQLRLAGHVELLGLAPGGHDHRPGGIARRLTHDSLPVPLRGDLNDFVHRELHPELAGLPLQALGQLRPADHLEAGVIFDPGGIHQLPA